MNAGDMNKREESSGEFVIAGSHATKLLDLKGFHQIPFLVFIPVTVPLNGFIELGRDTEICAAISPKVPEIKFSIRFVGQNNGVGKIKILHKLLPSSGCHVPDRL